MTSLGDTLARLRQLQQLPLPFAGVSGRLVRLWAFGGNPGGLRGWRYVPARLPAMAPLVIILHGCRQTAAAYDQGAGWSVLADEAKFALLFPEQPVTNNLYRCFNWFQPRDVSTEGGELDSIRQMASAMIRLHGLDPHRIFICGLSAGGAMAAAMVARFPSLFSGAAIIAGVPFGVAQSPQEAFALMGGHGLPSESLLAAILAQASDRAAVYPSLSLWQGEADEVVAPANADALEAQFRAALGVGVAASESETVGPATRRVWRDGNGHIRLERYGIPGMGHGTPLAPSEGLGQSGPFMLDVGLCSTRRIAAAWGIASATPPVPRQTSRRASLWRRLATWLKGVA